MCCSISFQRHNQTIGLLKTKPIKISLVIASIAIAVFSLLHISGCFGGPLWLKPVTLLLAGPALFTTGFFIYQIYGCMRLAKLGLVTKDFSKNTGDCLFENILESQDSEAIQRLRNNVVLYMQAHADDFPEDYTNGSVKKGRGQESLRYHNFEEYLECIRQQGVWGSPLEVKAAAFVLGCPIVLITPDYRQETYNPTATESPIFLHHVNGNHFVSCSPLNGLTNTLVFARLNA